VGRTPISFVTVKPQSTRDDVAHGDQNTQNPSILTVTTGNHTVITPSNLPTTPAVELETTSNSKLIIEKSSLAKSIGNRDIDLYKIGYAKKNEYAIFVVGEIAGEQIDTRYAVIDIYENLKNSPAQTLENSTLYLIPSLNPDGLDRNRANTRGVDLNRNWQSYNWTQDAPQPGGQTVRGTGGTNPFSEPETNSLQMLMKLLRSEGHQVRLLILHASAQSNRHEVYPGYISNGVPGNQKEIAKRIADLLNFSYSEGDSNNPTTGEAISWAAENGILTADVLWSRPDGNRPSVNQFMRVIEILAK